MARLLAFVLTLFLWSQSAEGGVRTLAGDLLTDEHACAAPAETGTKLDIPTVAADLVLLETEPNRGSRMSEGRHASPAAAFRTVLQLASTSEALAEDEAGWRVRRTVPVYYATAPPAPHRPTAA